MNVITKSGNLAPYLRATTQVVANNVKISPPVLPSAELVVPKTFDVVKTQSNNLLAAQTGIVGATSQVRLYSTSHRDVKPPSFDDYRWSHKKDPTRATDNEKQMTYHYLVTGGLWATGLYSAKYTVRSLCEYMGAARDALSMGTIEVKLGDIPEGKSVTFTWRGKPLFVRHRVDSEIAKENAVPLAELRDPQTDAERTKDPKWLIVVGVCTHLGCVPIANAGDFGGYYCPCHGSHYDASGRIRKGPAPLNLEVPEYTFKGDIVLVGA